MVALGTPRAGPKPPSQTRARAASPRFAQLVVEIDMGPWGTLVPLGLKLSNADEIIDLTPGGPAHESGGLRVGDRVVKVGARRTDGSMVGSTAVSGGQRG